MTIARGAMDKILVLLEQQDPTWRHYLSCCDEHLTEKADLEPGKLRDVRIFVRAERDQQGYDIVEGGARCEIGDHQASGWVIRKQGSPRLPTRQ